MKKLYLLLILVIVTFFARAQNTVTLEAGTSPVTTFQLRAKVITPDSLNHLWIYWNGKYNRIATMTETNLLYAPITGGGYAKLIGGNAFTGGFQSFEAGGSNQYAWKIYKFGMSTNLGGFVQNSSGGGRMLIYDASSSLNIDLNSNGTSAFNGPLSLSSVISATMSPNVIYRTPTGTAGTDSIKVKIGSTGKDGAIAGDSYTARSTSYNYSTPLAFNTPALNIASGDETTSLVVTVDTLAQWYKLGADTATYYRKTGNALLNSWSTAVKITGTGGGLFPYVKLHNGIYYMTLTKGTGGPSSNLGKWIYLYSSTNRKSWTVMNGGSPIFTASSTATDWDYYVFNTGFEFVGETIHILVEGSAASGAYSNRGQMAYGTFTLASPTLTLSAPVLDGGNAQLIYVPERNSIVALYSSVNTTTSPYDIRLKTATASLSSDLTKPGSWSTGFLLFPNLGTKTADADFVFTPGKTHSAMMFYNKEQSDGYYTYTDLAPNTLQLYTSVAQYKPYKDPLVADTLLAPLYIAPPSVAATDILGQKMSNGGGSNGGGIHTLYEDAGAQAEVGGLITGANENSGMALAFKTSSNTSGATTKLILERNGILVGKGYYAANYNDTAYVQKKYVVDNFSPKIGGSSITTVGTLSVGSIPYSLLSGTVPTWDQNTTGTASNITAYTINQNLGFGNSPTFANLNIGSAGYINYSAGSYGFIGYAAETNGQSINLNSITRAGGPYPMTFYSGTNYSFRDGSNVEKFNLNTSTGAATFAGTLNTSGNTITGKTESFGTNSTAMASTAFVQSAVSGSGVPSGSDGQIVSYYDGGVPLAIGRLSVQNANNYFTPTTGGTVTLVNNHENVINPSGSLVSLTFALPGSPADGDVVNITITQAITTISYSGGTVVGGLTSATLGTQYHLTYLSGTSTWY